MSQENNFNDALQLRTKKFATEIIRFFIVNCKKEEELRIIGKQFFRSGTSVAANFRAYIRGRSDAETYAKQGIVVEEIDETLFWFELLESSELFKPDLISNLKQEAFELLKIFSSVRSKMKAK
jgi:four helix bundle protein